VAAGKLARVRIVAFVTDLMDRSRLTGVDGGIEFTEELERARAADVVIIDLARHADTVAAVRAVAPDARIVVFGPHVDGDALARARADGADRALARSQFFRDPRAELDVLAERNADAEDVGG
jgi:hypothetical protein